MFTKKYFFNIKSDKVDDFIRLIGRYGLRFIMSDDYERYEEKSKYDWNITDNESEDVKANVRRFKVYGNKLQMRKFYEAVNVLKTVNHRLY